MREAKAQVGRPRGTTKEVLERRPAVATKWKPRRWKTEYEIMVLLSAQGWSNKMIAEKTGRSAVHVSNILNLEQAEELRQKLLFRLREKALEDIPNQLESIAVQATRRVKQILDNDELFEKSPFAVAQLGMKVMEGTGKLSKKADAGIMPGTNIIVQGGNVVLSGKRSEQLFEGLEKADSAKMLHSGGVPLIVNGKPQTGDLVTNEKKNGDQSSR